MLQAISWTTFLRTLFIAYTCWYTMVLLFFYWGDIMKLLRRLIKRKPPALVAAGLAIALMASHHAAIAQTADGNAGLSQANSTIRGYYGIVTQIFYAVGAIMAIIGAIVVFSRWNGHHQGNIATDVALWFGACIFLVLAATVIKAFFGI